MIKIERTDVSGWEAAIRGMRNPLNSWDKSDSEPCWSPTAPGGGCFNCENKHVPNCKANQYIVGQNDLDLMKRLVKSGSDHSKFMRMLVVTVDVTAPFYWWKEYDTYKVGTVANSCSTMHKLTAKEFTMDDFSFEDCDQWTKNNVCRCIIDALNMNRNKYLQTKDKEIWRQMVQLLPSSYNQKRTLLLNYAVLRNIYHSRKNHKLTEWHTFCAWVESLPYSELITM